MRVFLMFLMLLGIVVPALAADSVPPCACVAFGKRYAQGETICINGEIRRCGMSQNLSSWRQENRPCTLSLAHPTLSPQPALPSLTLQEKDHGLL
jgi:hypothetical protein